MLETNLVNQLYSEIKNKIISAYYEMGQKIELNKLADEFGVSQTPIREVLNRLVREGLVLNKPRYGYYVVDLKYDDIKNIYDIRKMMECYVIENEVALMKQDDLSEVLNDILELKGNAVINLEQHYLTDLKFHSYIINASTNNKLKEIYFDIYDLLRMFIRLTLEKLPYDETVDEHIEIITFLQKKEKKMACKSLRLHIDNSLKRLFLALKS